MTRILFRHLRNTQNIGDRWCSPYDHFPEFGTDRAVGDLHEPSTHCDVVVYGGGKIMGGLYRQLGACDLAATARIAWGVSTVQTVPFSWRYWQSFRKMTLVGSRDWGDKRFDFCPCASSNSVLFDKTYDEKHEVVAYLHHWKAEKMGIKVPNHIPTLDNAAATFEEVIRFIGSGRIVVSNSYHGVFWALLLGKRVLCLPFSKKFLHYRIPPGYSGPDDWFENLGKAKGSDEMLPVCREAGWKFQLKAAGVAGI